MRESVVGAVSKYVRPRTHPQHCQTEIQNLEYALVQLPKGKQLKDLKPPQEDNGTQTKIKKEDKCIQSDFQNVLITRHAVNKNQEQQTDLSKDKVFT